MSFLDKMFYIMKTIVLCFKKGGTLHFDVEPLSRGRCRIIFEMTPLTSKKGAKRPSSKRGKRPTTLEDIDLQKQSEDAMPGKWAEYKEVYDEPEEQPEAETESHRTGYDLAMAVIGLLGTYPTYNKDEAIKIVLDLDEEDYLLFIEIGEEIARANGFK